jgi:hypothetical protein
MKYVLLAEHSPDICPTSNAKTRKLLEEVAPQIPAIAEKYGVKILAGPYVNREHVSVLVAETNSGEDLDHFLLDSRLPQWNKVRVLPSLTMEEGMAEIQTLGAVF